MNYIGSAAKLQRREIAVLAKGVPVARLKEIHDDEALLAVPRQACLELGRRKRMDPKTQDARFGAILMEASTPGAA